MHEYDPALAERLREKADWVWQETLRIHQRAPETRVASSLSPVEIFVTLYYGGFLRQNPADPRWHERDRCIISKGHGSLCMYPILADLGYFPASELERVCLEGSFLGAIPDPVIPGYETINGSLGHGIGVGAGMALALKRRAMDQKVYVVCGDGELHEGANWEAFMFAAQHQLDNLIVLVDNNQICMLGATDSIVSHRDLRAKLTAFGWQVQVVDQGHSCECIAQALATSQRANNGVPQAVIFNTRKGNGVPGLENAPLSHVTPIAPNVLAQLLEAKR
ncbi:transketolase, N-terminal subunit [Pseudomonas turukhanskensis]|uniref:Transketolase, N-terminal subunit n=2 Tax=Pseudomonas turukhanskensis TaxID=1806536 RepID=A0A9W6NEI2_9PSED|nr:transketolase, N-terminal subunit [Pseudomonas turukhanskensis]